MTGAWYICGEQGHFRRDCLKRKEIDAAASEPPVQYSRAGSTGATYGRGRGLGQGANSMLSVNKQDPQGQ